MFTRTKIVCTIGPAVESIEKMLGLIEAGMNVARLNFSHGTHAQHEENIQKLKKARELLNVPLSLMLDMKGPKVRIGKVAGSKLEVKPGVVLTFTTQDDESGIFINPPEVISAMKPGMKVLFDDGYIIGKVLEASSQNAKIEMQNEGVLKDFKGVSLPGAILPLPAMTKKDFEDLEFGCKMDVDFVAASFIRSAQHVMAIKNFLASLGYPHMPVISKIECVEGLKNLDSIIDASDGIMIARGDLGVEVDLQEVPKLQKMMIHKCFQACKPVITATQMLESMIEHPRPTRAEVSDVANAIYDATSAVMLSAETAVGKYPIETVRLMKNIAKVTEDDFDYREFFQQRSSFDSHEISSSVAAAAVRTAYSCDAKAIFAITTSGATARLVSRLRPKIPVIAVTSSLKHYHQLAASFGVMPVYCPRLNHSKEAFAAAYRFAIENQIISFGDVVVVTASVPFRKKGTTNMMIVENIGEILTRAKDGFGPTITAEVSFLLSNDHASANLDGKIAFLSHADSSFEHLLKGVKGIILESWTGDVSSENYVLNFAKTHQISCLIQAKKVVNHLREGTIVTMDPEKKIAFTGCAIYDPEKSFSL